MMQIPIHQVDAFASQVFRGNPAAVCPLDRWLPDATLQAVAAENNLSETAFLVPAEKPGEHELRWFTPTVEVDLCGHATLASGYVVNRHLAPGQQRMLFHSRSGPLSVEVEGELLTLDFPARPPQPLDDAGAVAAALGVEPLDLLAADKAMAVLADETAVRAVAPDMARVASLPQDGVIVTAPGDDCDFVSRYFAPGAGIPEDPVTGSAHCVLTPYWAARLGRTRLQAKQVSARGGELLCVAAGERVRLSGRVAPYLQGTIQLPAEGL